MYSSENSHKATSNADLILALVIPASVGQQVLAGAFLTSVDWSPLCPVIISLTACFVDWSLLLSSADCPSLDCYLMPTVIFCSLLLTPSSLVPSFPRPSGLVGDLVCWPFVWVSRQNRQRDSVTGTHIHKNGYHP